MGPKRPGDEQPKKKLTKDSTDTDATQKPADGAESNVVFPRQYTERLKQDSAENIGHLKAIRQEALAGIDRDIEALGQDGHGLGSGVADQFITLLKSARQELLQSDTLSVEQGEYLQATGKRLEALVEKVKSGIKDSPSD